MRDIEAPGFTIPGIEDITRRDFLVGGAAALLLAGCGSGGGGGNEEASGEMRTVEHFMGKTEIPVNPQRIVTLSLYELGWPLAQMGVETIGNLFVPEMFEELKEFDPEAAALLEDSPSVGGNEGPNFERLAEADPDLIIGGWFNEDIYQDLSKIAPTVLLDFREETDIVAWQRKLAGIVGVTEADPDSLFEQRLARYEERIQALKGAYPDRWENLE